MCLVDRKIITLLLLAMTALMLAWIFPLLSGNLPTVPSREQLGGVEAEIANAETELAWMSEQHVVERHGLAGLTVAEACKSGKYQTWKTENVKTGRTGTICLIDDKFGIMIEEGDNLVTSFFKEKLKRLDQALRYMENAGYK